MRFYLGDVLDWLSLNLILYNCRIKQGDGFRGDTWGSHPEFRTVFRLRRSLPAESATLRSKPADFRFFPTNTLLMTRLRRTIRVSWAFRIRGNLGGRL